MSGGSYDYLYNGLWIPGTLIDMADRLDELAPGSQAARDTRTIVRLLETQKLLDVWQAVEWFDSHDWSEEQAREVIDAYEPP